MNKALVFFDDECALCHKVICFLHARDKHHRLGYAPLKGKTAHRYLMGRHGKLKQAHTVVLLELSSGKIWTLGRAVFKTLSYLGGAWSLLGLMYHLPLIDYFYRCIACRRKREASLPPLPFKILP